MDLNIRDQGWRTLFPCLITLMADKMTGVSVTTCLESLSTQLGPLMSHWVGVTIDTVFAACLNTVLVACHCEEKK